jgi:hypothetical protein
MKRLTTLILLLLSAAITFGQTKWVDATSLNICGHTIRNAKNPYSRIDAEAYGFTNKAILRYSQYSTGLYVVFKTNSTQISAKWSVATSKVRDNITPITQLGVDLYIKDNGKWRFCNVGRVKTNPKITDYTCNIIKNMAEGDKEFMLYLPMWSEITKLSIGVDSDASIESAPSPYRHTVVTYGSSTPHGASPSRPGLAMLARMSRDLGIDFINYCFSGNAKLEMESAEVLADCKTDAILCYCFGNPSAKQIEERTDAFVERVVKAHPTKPIIFIAVAFSILLMLMAPEGVYIIGGEEYMSCLEIVPVLVLGIFFSSFYFIFSNIEFVYERTKLVFPITLLGAGLNIVLNYLLIPKMGYGAAAYTTLISYIVVALCHYLATLFIIKRNAYPMGTICLYLGALIGATLLMPLIYQIHFLLRYLIVLLAVAALGFVLLRGRRPAGNKNGGNDEATDL